MSTQDQTSTAQSTPAAGTNTGTTQETSNTQSTATEQSAQSDQGQGANQTTQTQEVSKGSETVFDLKLPEGTTLNKEYADKVTSFAKENGLTPVQAQKILDRDHALVSATKQAAQDNLNKQIDAWVNQVQEDKVLGGENFAANMETVKRGFDRFSTPELKDLLKKSGYGSHPEVVRMFYTIGKAISDDSFNKGGATKSEGSTLGSILYG